VCKYDPPEAHAVERRHWCTKAAVVQAGWKYKLTASVRTVRDRGRIDRDTIGRGAVSLEEMNDSSFRCDDASDWYVSE
jgi:hypothetical protein